MDETGHGPPPSPSRPPKRLPSGRQPMRGYFSPYGSRKWQTHGWDNHIQWVGTRVPQRRTMSYIPGLVNDNDLYTSFRYLRRFRPGNWYNALLHKIRFRRPLRVTNQVSVPFHSDFHTRFMRLGTPEDHLPGRHGRSRWAALLFHLVKQLATLFVELMFDRIRPLVYGRDLSPGTSPASSSAGGEHGAKPRGGTQQARPA